RRPWGAALVLGAAYGVASWGWLVWEATSDRRTLVVDFLDTPNPAYRAWRAVLPDGMRAGVADDLLLVAWAVALGVLAWWGWRTPSREPASREPASPGAARQPAATVSPG